MSTTATQERLKVAVKALEDFSDELDAKGADLSAEDLGNLKTRMEEIKDLKGQVETEAEAKGATADAKAFLAQLGGGSDDSAKSEKFTPDGRPMATGGKTLGEMFVESDVYGSFTKQYVRGGVIPNQVKGIQSNPFQMDAKALITGASSTSAGAAIRNDLYAPIVDLVGQRELTILDLVTQGTTESDSVDYVRVTGKTNNAAAVAEATSAAAPTTGASSGAVLTLNAGGGYKPESGMTLEQITAAVKTLAHWIPITKRAAADAGQVRTLVDNFLLYGLAEVKESQVLNGNGAGENLTGILQTAGIQTVGSAGTDIDAVVDAIAKVRTIGRRKPTGLVIHPNDWYSTGFLTAKDAQGNYLIGDPRASVEQLNTLWGLNVVVTEAMTENTALVGDFRQAVYWKREDPSILVSDQHADFFVRNLLALLAEERGAFGVLDPEAFCTITAV